METLQGYKEAGMQFALFNQLQMPKPWRENAEVLMYKEAIAEAMHAEAVGCDAYWQTEHHFYTEIGHSSAPEIVLAALSQRMLQLRLGLGVMVLPCNHPYRVVESPPMSLYMDPEYRSWGGHQ
jgi:alkanesulfonate monooxygenase SsuD/methylene tetrahydromethanopterin reductase-like flavin-dependent oxidoreductase (luciferase family)